MALTAEQTARLAELDAILAAGVEVVRQDGRAVEYNLDAARKERDQLRRLAVVARTGSQFRRVKLVQADG